MEPQGPEDAPSRRGGEAPGIWRGHAVGVADAAGVLLDKLRPEATDATLRALMSGSQGLPGAGQQMFHGPLRTKGICNLFQVLYCSLVGASAASPRPLS